MWNMQFKLLRMLFCVVPCFGQTTPSSSTSSPPSVCSFNGPPCKFNKIYRRFDGSCSNPSNQNWGYAGSPYIYLIPPSYDNGVNSPKTKVLGNILPSARVLKNTFFPDGNALSQYYSVATMVWGQFYAHDLSLSGIEDDDDFCCTSDAKISPRASDSCYPMLIPEDDPIMSPDHVQCLNFSKVLTDHKLNCPQRSKLARPLNVVTPALDLSPLYGNSLEECNNLRTFKDGQLRTERRNGITYPPSTFTPNSLCSVTYETGDLRSNQNAPLLVIHMLMINKHNDIATKLLSINPQWNDERLFQETRRIMIAIFQKITYYEWLPIILGPQIAYDYGIVFDAPDYVDDFDPSINLGATNENSHAASRILHTIIPDTIDLYAENRTLLSQIKLSDNFFCQEIFENPDVVSQVSIGMITQPMGEFDDQHPKSITEELFKAKTSTFGTDLRSIDIQRSRNIGLSSYVSYLKLCGLIRPGNDFGDFRDFRGIIQDDLIDKLARMYVAYDAVDLSTGLGLETPMHGSNLGPTTLCLLIDQTLRSRLGDEKWFEHLEANFTPDQLQSIKSVTFSKFFCDGVNVKNIQQNAFYLPSLTNIICDCNNFTSLNLSLWREG